MLVRTSERESLIAKMQSRRLRPRLTKSRPEVGHAMVLRITLGQAQLRRDAEAKLHKDGKKSNSPHMISMLKRAQEGRAGESDSTSAAHLSLPVLLPHYVYYGHTARMTCTPATLYVLVPPYL